MKSYLVSIDNVIQDSYKKLSKNPNEQGISDFCEDVVSILDYYTKPIFKSGKMTVYKKINNPILDNYDLNDVEEKFIEEYKFNDLNQFKDTLSNALNNIDLNKDLLEDLIEISIGKCIKLFKYAQLSEYKNNNISKVKLITGNDSCYICKSRSNHEYDVKMLMEKLDDFIHPFCKLIFECNDLTDNYINKKIKSIEMRLNISCRNLITKKKFEIVDEIVNELDFVKTLENKYDNDKVEELKNQLSGKISMFEIDNKVLISRKHTDKLDYIVTKSLLKDKLSDEDLIWWRERYYKKQENKYIGNDVAIYTNPFVSCVAEQSYESYFLESAIYYILNPELLLDIDKDNYERLKHEIYSEIEFMRR